MESTYLKDTTIEDVLNDSSWLEDVGKDFADEPLMFNNLLTAIKCPSEYIELFHIFIKTLQQVLRKHFKRQRLSACGFGSYFSGLCLKNCDLDMFIRLDPPTLNVPTTLRYIKNTISKQMRRDFIRIFVINAKIPIIRCRHVVGFDCDVSLNNEAALYNSKLIKLYVDFNSRIYTFLMCLKLWWKRQALSNSSDISSYALVLLGIFYLQNENHVPTVAELQSHEGKPRIIQGWDTSFSTDYSFFNNKKETTSVIKLLQGFFLFYSRFDFGHFIISPFVGKEIFKSLDNLPNEFKLYKEQERKFDSRAYSCLQDPFDHSFNTTKNTRKATLLNFQSWCDTAYNICNQGCNQTFLKELLTVYEKGPRKRVHESNEFDVVVTWGKAVLPGSDLNQQWQVWTDSVLEAFEYILTKILLAKLERTDNLFNCEFNHCTFVHKTRKRITHEMKIPNEGPSLEKQELVTKKIMELAPFERNLATPLKTCVKVQCLTKPSRAVLQFEILDTKENAGYALRKHFTKTLPGWIEQFIDVKFGENHN